MNRVIRLGAIFLILAALMGLPSFQSMAQSEWSASVSLEGEASAEGVADLIFGVAAGATDSYDSGLDVPHPPAGPGATFDAYLAITHATFSQLNTDMRGPATDVVWTVQTTSSQGSTVSWNISGVPSNVALTLSIPGQSLIDMSAQQTASLGPGPLTLTITATEAIPWSADVDLDGHYAIGSALQPADDCDDNDGSVYPGAPEICDGKDNDCDGLVDSADPDYSGVDPCPPIPEWPAIGLMTLGLMGLGGFLWIRRRNAVTALT